MRNKGTPICALEMLEYNIVKFGSGASMDHNNCMLEDYISIGITLVLLKAFAIFRGNP
jgi:hypothetical protein